MECLFYEFWLGFAGALITLVSCPEPNEIKKDWWCVEFLYSGHLRYLSQKTCVAIL